MNWLQIYFMILVIGTGISAVIYLIPPLRRWYFKMFFSLYEEAFNIGMNVVERLFEKFE